MKNKKINKKIYDKACDAAYNKYGEYANEYEIELEYDSLMNGRSLRNWNIFVNGFVLFIFVVVLFLLFGV